MFLSAWSSKIVSYNFPDKLPRLKSSIVVSYGDLIKILTSLASPVEILSFISRSVIVPVSDILIFPDTGIYSFCEKLILSVQLISLL